MPLTQQKTHQKSTYTSFRAQLADGAETTVHVARYPKETVRPELVLFDEETVLLDWCEANEITDAMVGGFFLRLDHKPLGDMWLKGQLQDTVSFLEPWAAIRGSLHIDTQGMMAIGPRDTIVPTHELLQAGPLLVRAGKSVIIDGFDPEGMSAGSSQFDSDITIGRYPRSAIATNDTEIISVVCDGRFEGEAGLTLQEFANVLVEQGAQDALNLDGRSSATLIERGELRNKPRSDDALFKRGRAIYSGIVFRHQPFTVS